MRVLLDTCSFLWFIAGDDKLSRPAKKLIADLDNQMLVSVASLWEIALKVKLGKLTLLRPFEELIPRQLTLSEIDKLPIELNHLTLLTQLPWHHGEPFERLIIAQALAEALPVISHNDIYKKYQIQIIW
ncbi:MAG: type II toxin-antitoxin system VapC family toxin [Pseudomonadota bacterium]|nr:type II toxin-antitoxin system VapC family toxin [Pseudomonadota bacterium]